MQTIRVSKKILPLDSQVVRRLLDFVSPWHVNMTKDTVQRELLTLLVPFNVIQQNKAFVSLGRPWVTFHDILLKESRILSAMFLLEQIDKQLQSFTIFLRPFSFIYLLQKTTWQPSNHTSHSTSPVRLHERCFSFHICSVGWGPVTQQVFHQQQTLSYCRAASASWGDGGPVPIWLGWIECDFFAGSFCGTYFAAKKYPKIRWKTESHVAPQQIRKKHIDK